MSKEQRFAQYAATGTFEGTYRAGGRPSLDFAHALAGEVSPELVAKAALWCRGNARMVDMPALLVAHLASRDTDVMSRVFARVIDDGRMLRSFVQVVRSGVTGRRSFGSAPKRALRSWFASRSPEVIFRQSFGQSPSMSDVIKMVRPPPRNDKGEADAVREALYGYLIGKSVNVENLPRLTRAFVAWKHGEGPLPDVPFEMLTCLPLRAEHWKELAKKMPIQELRQKLETLLHYGVFDDADVVESVATRLQDPDTIRRTNALPFPLLAALHHVSAEMPAAVVRALGRAVDHAIDNLPEIPGDVAVHVDASGSMQAPFRGQLRCAHVADFVAAAVRRKSGPTSDVARTDVVIVVSDDQSSTLASDVAALAPGARLVRVDLRPRALGLGQVGDDHALCIEGFSDSVFDVIASFARGELSGADWLSRIDAVDLHATN
ncbi:MAG: TROVE domain-containing protein [Deltaproteobacteria bacterium]|nr:TROVE domain-containing protein [Deltaproteobacteria bacterium]